MAGTAQFPLVVEIAFAAGPFDQSPVWTDVSAYVQRAKSVQLSRGIDPETGEPIAGRATLRLKNDDGRFTPGDTTTYGLIRNKLPIRVSAVVATGTYVLWTGLIEKWAMQYENGVRPVVDVTCVDRWARFQARKLTDERYQPAVIATTPIMFWPMTDDAGSSRAAEVVNGKDAVPVNPAGVTFAGATNPQTGNSTNVLSATDFKMTYGTDAVVLPAMSYWSFGGWLWNGRIRGWWNGNDFVDLNVNTSYMNVTGYWDGISATVAYSGTVTSGWHHIIATGAYSGSAWTLKLYVDGQLAGSKNETVRWANPLRTLDVYGTGVAYVAGWNRALSATEIAELYKAGKLDWQGDTADVRADRIAAINGKWPIDFKGTFTSTMSKPAFTGKTVATGLLECAQAEAGVLYVDRDGWPVLESRSSRAASVLVATIPAQVLSSDVQWELDDQALNNVVTVDRMAMDVTATTVNRRNETSIAAYDEASKSLQLWLDSDAQAVERADMEVTMWATPLPRSRTFTIDLATSQATISQATVLAVDVGSRIAVSGLPATAPDASGGGWYVDQIEDSISHTTWTRTFTVSPVKDFFVLENATYGALDSTFVLAY